MSPERGRARIRTLPPPSFFVPAALAQTRRAHDILEAAREAPRALHLTHAGCLDGAASDAVLRASAGAEEVRTLWTLPHDALDTFERATAVPGRGRRLVVTDLSLQKGEGTRLVRALAAAGAVGWSVEWRDHHARQWDDVPLDQARATGARVVVERDGRECGATLLARDVGLADARWDRLLAAVRDHDLWLQEDALAMPLADAHRALGSAAFVEALLAGAEAHDARFAEAAAGEASRRRAAAAEGVAVAAFAERKGARVGFVYGDLPTNDVLHALYTERGADVGALFKPEGTFSLRSRKGADVCHLVAQAFGGGGHPNAAGGTLGLRPWELPAYWALRARHPRARRVVRLALDEVAALRAP